MSHLGIGLHEGLELVYIGDVSVFWLQLPERYLGPEAFGYIVELLVGGIDAYDVVAWSDEGVKEEEIC